MKLILVIMMAALGVAFVGCDTRNKPTTTVGQALDDTAITAKVKAALLNEPEVKSGDISVETVTGTVTLSGSVSSDAQSQRVVAIVRSVEGVKDVQNRLSVKHVYNPQPNPHRYSV